MAAFEQSLTTLNTRLRQLTALNEKKDQEIEELRNKLGSIQSMNEDIDSGAKSDFGPKSLVDSDKSKTSENEKDNTSEQNLMEQVANLRRQLVEKDRLLTDMRLEALSAAHQLEQMESKFNRDHSLVTNDEDLDEGVLVANHSPSDSDAITDSAHFSEINSQSNKPACSQFEDDNIFMHISSGLETTTPSDRQGSSETRSSPFSDTQRNESDRRSRSSDEYPTKNNFDECNSSELNSLLDSLLLTN